MKYILSAWFACCLLLAPVCADDAPDEKAIWKPSTGDSWVYKVVLEVAKDAKLPMDVAGQKIEKLDDKIRATYTQTSVYRGLVTEDEDDKKSDQSEEANKSEWPEGVKVHAFHIFNADRLMEIHYMSIKKDAVEALGTKQEGETPGNPIKLSQPVPLVNAAWKGGETIPLEMTDRTGKKAVLLSREFRVLGWETLETEAGKFKALHVHVVGMNGPMEIKRNYWFAPGTGFIKEVKKYYLGDTIIMTQTKVLQKTVKQQAGG